MNITDNGHASVSKIESYRKQVRKCKRRDGKGAERIEKDRRRDRREERERGERGG